MGDPEVGTLLYQKYCSVCHGAEGDGNGIVTKLMGIMPMDHTNRTRPIISTMNASYPDPVSPRQSNRPC